MAKGALYGHARSLAHGLAQGDIGPEVGADALRSMDPYLIKSEELLAMVDVFQGLASKVDTQHERVMDLCGTGGASVRTFNVGTVSSFIVAASGSPVAKHGNRSANGKCGSADLLEALGADISIPPQRAAEILDDIGFSFFFAPNHHPSVAAAAEARRMAGGVTVFNMMGPLLNPVRVKRDHLMGVWDPRHLDIVPEVLIKTGVERAMVVYGDPGMDEVSLCGSTSVAHLTRSGIERYEICPEMVGMDRCPAEALRELPPAAAAQACKGILAGQEGERRDQALLSSACALLVQERRNSLQSCLSLAEESLDSGAAEDLMHRYIRASTGGCNDV